MCFVWISEQTAIISLYNINWLVCVTETECVYCAVRTGCLSITLRVLSQFRLLIASLSPRWHRFDSRPAHMRFVVELWHWTDLSPNTSVSFHRRIPPVLQTHLHLHAALIGRKEGRSLGTFQKCSSRNGGAPKALRYPQIVFFLYATFNDCSA